MWPRASGRRLPTHSACRTVSVRISLPHPLRPIVVLTGSNRCVGECKGFPKAPQCRRFLSPSPPRCLGLCCAFFSAGEQAINHPSITTSALSRDTCQDLPEFLTLARDKRRKVNGLSFLRSGRGRNPWEKGFLPQKSCSALEASPVPPSKIRSPLKAPLPRFSSERTAGLSKPLRNFVGEMLFGIPARTCS